jgi:hypothetical protein
MKEIIPTLLENSDARPVVKWRIGFNDLYLAQKTSEIGSVFNDLHKSRVEFPKTEEEWQELQKVENQRKHRIRNSVLKDTKYLAFPKTIRKKMESKLAPAFSLAEIAGLERKVEELKGTVENETTSAENRGESPK